MPDVSTEVAIATTTLGSASATITFSSIPATYTDLRIVQVLTGTTNAYSKLRFNGDTASNYSSTNIRADGSSASSQWETNDNGIRINGNYPVTSVPSLNTVDVFSYAGSTNKTVLNRALNDQNGAGGLVTTVGLWRNTAAITSITIYEFTGDTFAAGTTATLYGIL
jgi:hypothetical protein